MCYGMKKTTPAREKRMKKSAGRKARRFFIPIKKKRGKPMFKNAIKLDQRIAVYVPATDNANEAVNNDAMVKKCAALLSDLFGGATIQESRGAWLSEKHGLILEDTTVVYAYCTADGLRDHAEKVEAFALDMKAAMHQEAVSVEVNNALYIF